VPSPEKYFSDIFKSFVTGLDGGINRLNEKYTSVLTQPTTPRHNKLNINNIAITLDILVFNTLLNYISKS